MNRRSGKRRGAQAPVAAYSPPIGTEFTVTASGNLQPTTLEEAKSTGNEGEDGAHTSRVDLGDCEGGGPDGKIA